MINEAFPLKPDIHFSWLRAGRAYLDDGRRFVNECTTMAAMSRKGLARVDLCRAEFDAAEAVYNQIIEDMEVSPSCVKWMAFVSSHDPFLYSIPGPFIVGVLLLNLTIPPT